MKQQIKIAELLKRIETSKQQDVELGTYEIYVFSESELEKGQIGYRYDKHKSNYSATFWCLFNFTSFICLPFVNTEYIKQG